MINAGCHAIKKLIIESDQSEDRVLYDAIELQDVETRTSNGDVWEVSGRYPKEHRNPFVRWKVVLLLVTTTVEGVEHLIYEPREIWTGDQLDQLYWTSGGK